MIAPKTLPIHPFWNFSVKIYADPLVEQNLLQLQQRGLNVNILLFCIWHALSDQELLSQDDINQMLAHIERWHQEVIEPLRRIRQQLKGIKDSPWPLIRQDVLQGELVCEQVEQCLFLRHFRFQNKSARDSIQRLIDTCKNMAQYCRALNVCLDRQEGVKIAQMLSVIFNQIDQEIILRYCIDHIIVGSNRDS